MHLVYHCPYEWEFSIMWKHCEHKQDTIWMDTQRDFSIVAWTWQNKCSKPQNVTSPARFIGRRRQKFTVLIWDKCAEWCGQRGRKSRYNYVIREGGSGIERRVVKVFTFQFPLQWGSSRFGCSKDTAYHLVYGELHSFGCLRKHATTWVWRERIRPKTKSFTHFHHQKTHHLKGGHAQMWQHAQMICFFLFVCVCVCDL